MKILVFLHGTTIMHTSAAGLERSKRVRQAAEGTDESLSDFGGYIPIGDAVAKLYQWQNQGATIEYLSSHRRASDVAKDLEVLQRFFFPDGMVRFRGRHQSYASVVRTVAPDILVEDDCESMGPRAADGVVAPHLRGLLRRRTGSIVVPEFGGIDHLPSALDELVTLSGARPPRPFLTALLRFIRLAAMTGVAWYGLATLWTVPTLLERLLPIVLVLAALLVGFRDDPYLRRSIYVGAAALTAGGVVVTDVIRGTPGGWEHRLGVITTALAGFLSLAVATYVLSRFLFLIKLGDDRARELRRRGAPLEAHQTLIRVLAGAYGIPVGVFTSVLVGVIIAGWPGAVAGVACGIAAGALAWTAGHACAWWLPGEPGGLAKAASTAPSDVAAIGLGVVSTLVATSSQVSGLVLDQSVQLVFAPVVAVVLTQFALLASVTLLRGKGRIVMALLAMVGGAVGIAWTGWSGQLLIGGLGRTMLTHLQPLILVAAGAAVMAFVVQRLGSTIGFTAAASLAVIHGSTWWVVLSWGLAGAFGGEVLASVVVALLGVASATPRVRFTLLLLSLLAAIALGLSSGMAVPVG